MGAKKRNQIIALLENGHPVMFHGSADNIPGHWMLATAVLKHPTTGAVTRLVSAPRPPKSVTSWRLHPQRPRRAGGAQISLPWASKSTELPKHIDGLLVGCERGEAVLDGMMIGVPVPGRGSASPGRHAGLCNKAIAVANSRVGYALRVHLVEPFAGKLPPSRLDQCSASAIGSWEPRGSRYTSRSQRRGRSGTRSSGAMCRRPGNVATGASDSQ